MNIEQDLLYAINRYLAAMSADYARFAGDRLYVEAYKIRIDNPGRDVVRIKQRGSAHSFIALRDCVKQGLALKRGDILKVKSWRAPTLNFARGNVLENRYGACDWTGAD